MTGSQTVVEVLKKEGVDTIFGYPGGAVIPLFDALYDEESINLILTRHEQAAVHAADGYARSTGKTGVCIVTSGPGATNTVTGLATANFDSVPVVCISGQVPRQMIGNDAFQEADTVGITRPVTKHNYLVTNPDKLASALRESFLIASTGRPGPVVVDIPKDILTSEQTVEIPEKVAIRGYRPTPVLDRKNAEKAAMALNMAERPLIFAGGGTHISGSAEALNRLLSKTGAPLISSLMGIGIVPSNDSRYLGMLGMHGSYAANMAVQNADLILGVGVRFDDRATGDLSRFAPHAKIIHIDIDPTAIARNVPVEIPVVGDATEAIEEILKTTTGEKSYSAWWETIEGYRRHYRGTLPEDTSGTGLTPEKVISLLGGEFPEAVVATEVGQNQMWAAQYFPFTSPRSFLTSGGLGTMGYGFPAAMGAQAGNPGRRVLTIAGDGSIQMNIQELATTVIERYPVIIAILNNGYLGMVRQWQEMFCDKRYAKTCLQRVKSCPPDCSSPDNTCPVYIPDFVALAKAYGAAGFRASTMEEAVEAVNKAAEINDRPVILDFIIPREENVWPMVSPGAALHEMTGQGGPL